MGGGLCVTLPFSLAFNEVAHQPPTLNLPRGANLNTEARRPGATKNLLLLDKLKKVI